MSPDRRASDRLSDHLDALVVGKPPRSPDLDPAIDATVARFFAADDAPEPPPGLAEHLWEELMHTLAIPVAPEPDSHLLPIGRINKPWSGAPLALPPARGRWVVTQLATAALVLLVLAGSFVALGPWRSGPPAWEPALPVITGTPSAEKGIGTETLIDDADTALPAGPATIRTMVTELQPGVSSTLGGQVGAMLYRVEQGTVTISHTGVEQLFHSGEQWAAPVNGEAASENVGGDVARIVEVAILDSIATTSIEANHASKFSDPQGGSDHRVITVGTDLPGGVGWVTLERLTLPPGTALEPYAKSSFDWVGVAAGRLGVTLAGQRLPFRWDPGEERTFGLFQSLPVIPAGTEVTLRNAGDGPLILYRLTLTPNAATPQPP